MNSSSLLESVSIILPEGVRRELLVHNQKYTVTRMHLDKGVESPPHQHPHEQVIYLLSGRGVFDVGNRCLALEAGQCISIASNVFHAFKPPEEKITFLEFFVPGREDIVKQQ